jgi:hypothetical protein
MVDLSALIQAAHGGDAISSIAAQFGISPEQANAAISALAPAIAAGVQNHLQTPEGLSNILGHLTDPAHQAAYNDSNAAAPSAPAASAGGDLLGQLFGGAGGVSQIAQHVGAEAGISPEIMNQLMPVVTSMAMGGVAKAAQDSGLGGLLSSLGGGAAGDGLGGGLGGILSTVAASVSQGGQSGGGLGGMLGGLVGSLLGGRGAAPAGAAPGGAPSAGGIDPAMLQAGMSALSGLFQSGGASGGLQSILGQVLAKR